MNIKAIVIEGTNGDVEIARTGGGAHAVRDHAVLADFPRDESREARYEKARQVAGFVYGTDRQGRPAATNSMVHEVLDAIERVAGC